MIDYCLTNNYCIVMMYFQPGVAVEMSFSGCANLGFFTKLTCHIGISFYSTYHQNVGDS
jgi:hypothetical protein